MSTVTFPLLALNRHRMATDGEGVTTLVAGAGCPLHCKWCINKKVHSAVHSKQFLIGT